MEIATSDTNLPLDQKTRDGHWKTVQATTSGRLVQARRQGQPLFLTGDSSQVNNICEQSGLTLTSALWLP